MLKEKQHWKYSLFIFMFVTQRVPSIVYIAWGKICILALISFKRGSLSSLGSLHVVNISADWNSAFLSREDWKKTWYFWHYFTKELLYEVSKTTRNYFKLRNCRNNNGNLSQYRDKKKKIYIYIYDFLAHNISSIVWFFAYENIDIGRSAYSVGLSC